jgi:hypothetical protein
MTTLTNSDFLAALIGLLGMPQRVFIPIFRAVSEMSRSKP